MDDIEREAIRDEGYDPDDPAVLAGLDQVRAELAAVGRADAAGAVHGNDEQHPRADSSL